MRKLLIAVPLLLAAPLIAQQSPPKAPGAADPARVTAGSYVVEKNHTQIRWSVSHFGFNDYFGLFGEPTGTLELDPKKPNAAKVSIDIPINQVATSSKGLTDHLQRPGKDGKAADFFDVAAHPSAKFVSTSVVANGTTAKINGNLTLNGVTKPVTLEAKFSGAGVNPYSKKATVGFHATTMIKRSNWGMTMGVPVIGDEVKLDISVAFEK